MPARCKHPPKPNGKSKRRSVHVVVTHAKYCAGGPFFWTEVVFRSAAEIDALIVALKNLKKSRSTESHFHISDLHLAKDGPSSSAEIVFYRLPRRRFQERRKAVRVAEQMLRKAKGEALGYNAERSPT